LHLSHGRVEPSLIMSQHNYRWYLLLLRQ
jgi:hypothetical protein